MTDDDKEIWDEIAVLREEVAELRIRRERLSAHFIELNTIKEQMNAVADRTTALVANMDEFLAVGEQNG